MQVLLAWEVGLSDPVVRVAHSPCRSLPCTGLVMADETQLSSAHLMRVEK